MGGVAVSVFKVLDGPATLLLYLRDLRTSLPWLLLGSVHLPWGMEVGEESALETSP